MFAKDTQKKILKTLYSPKSISQLKLLTKIPSRTLRCNLAKLKSKGLIKEKFIFGDMRKKLFYLNGGKDG